MRGLRARSCARQDSLVDRLFSFVKEKGDHTMVNLVSVVLSCISLIVGLIDNAFIDYPLILKSLQAIARILP